MTAADKSEDEEKADATGGEGAGGGNSQSENMPGGLTSRRWSLHSLKSSRTSCCSAVGTIVAFVVCVALFFYGAVSVPTQGG